MPGSVSLFHVHAVLEFDYAILTYTLHIFALCRGPKGGMTQSSPLNTPLDVHVLMITAYWSQLETIQAGASPAERHRGFAPPPDFNFCPPPDLFLAFPLYFFLKMSIALSVKIVVILTVPTSILTSILFD